MAEGGCVAPGAEADALLRATSEGLGPIEELIARRLRGEPLAWIIGSVRFCGVRVRVELPVREMKGEIDARELTVELLREVGRARAQAVAHARALGVAHRSEPAVLQRRQRREQHDEDDTGGKLPRRARSIVNVHGHESTLREMRERIRAVYISYKTIAQR